MEGPRPDKLCSRCTECRQCKEKHGFPAGVQKVCKHPEKGKSHEESYDSSLDFGALEGTRIPGPLIKRAYFDGFLRSELVRNTRFYGIFISLRPVAASHVFSSCCIFVELFYGTITGTFFISHDKQGFKIHNFGWMKTARFCCHWKNNLGWLPCPISGYCVCQNFTGVSLAVGIGRGENYCPI